MLIPKSSWLCGTPIGKSFCSMRHQLVQDPTISDLGAQGQYCQDQLWEASPPSHPPKKPREEKSSITTPSSATASVTLSRKSLLSQEEPPHHSCAMYKFATALDQLPCFTQMHRLARIPSMTVLVLTALYPDAAPPQTKRMMGPSSQLCMQPGSSAGHFQMNKGHLRVKLKDRL